METTVGSLWERFSKGTDSQLIKPHTSWILTHVNGGRDLARHAGRITYTAFGSYVGVRRSVKLVDLSLERSVAEFRLDAFTPSNFTPEKIASERVKCQEQNEMIRFLAIKFLFSWVNWFSEKNIFWQINSSSTLRRIIIFLIKKLICRHLSSIWWYIYSIYVHVYIFWLICAKLKNN